MTQASPALGRAEVTAGVLDALRGAGVELCVLRNYETLPDPGGHDVDALFEDARRTAALRALERGLASRGLRLVQCNARRSLVQAVVADAACSAGSVVHFDLFTHVGHWRGLTYLPALRILGEAQRRGGVLIPRPAHEACLSLVGPLLNAGRVKRAYVERCAALAASDREAFGKTLAEAFGREVAAGMTRLLDARDADGLDALRPRVRGALMRNAGAGGALAAAAYAVDKAVSVATRDRLDIAVIGPDGVGKTTLMKGIGEALRRSFPGGVAYQHFRPRPFAALKGRVSEGGQLQRTTDHVHPNPGQVQRAISVARLAVSGGLFTLGYATSILPAKLRRKLVLLDRYAYGYVIEPAALKYYGPPGLAWLMLRLIPRPDLTILLTAEPETIRARKPELTVEEIVAQLSRGREVARRLSRVVEVDASGGVDAAMRRVTSAALKHLAERTAGRKDAPGDRGLASGLEGRGGA